MSRGRRQPDNIGLELDHTLEASVRRKKFELIQEIRENYHFRELTKLAQGADLRADDRLAHAILDARWHNMPVGPVIEMYAQAYIYPHRKKR